MKTSLRVTLLGAVLALLNLPSFAQNNPLGGVLSGITSFQKIKVTQESVFQGKVLFDNGLTLNGDARFLNNVIGDGSLSIAKNIRFSGLQDNSTIDYIITGNVAGDLSRIPLPVLVQQLQSQLKSLNELNVNNLTKLNGQLILGQDLQINGVANFANDILLQGNLSVAGGIKLNLPSAVNELPLGNTVLTFDPASNSIIPVSGTAIGLPIDPQSACPEQLLPASWERAVNKLVTDRCSRNIKVGIGLQSPTEMLEVAGNIKTSNSVFAEQFVAQNSSGKDPLIVKINGVNKFKVASSGKTYTTEVNVVMSNAFPDYVFKKDYQLMPLGELEGFIAKNGHLPGMPTAEEVSVNGADLGELTRKLTEKVEELTIYMLQLEQKNKNLEEKLNEIVKRGK